MSKDGVHFTAVEHILSALHGMFVDNAVVEVGAGEEIPIAGKVRTKEFCEAIESGGRITQEKLARTLRPKESIGVVVTDERLTIAPSRSSFLTVHARIDFPVPIGVQTFRFSHRGPKAYYNEIAPARSFIRSSLLKQWPNGSISLDNVVEELRLLPRAKDSELLMSFADEQWLTTPLTTREAAKHKIQDFMGDVALLGRRLIATVILEKPGHCLHLKAIRKIKTALIK